MYRFVEHTAELELELEAGSAEGVLLEALRAFADLVDGTDGADGEEVERRVTLSAGDPPALLAAWLDELVFLADTEELVPEAAEIRVDGTSLTGVVRGRRGMPRPLVKAVTLHRLRFGRDGGAWRGRVVLDV